MNHADLCRECDAYTSLERRCSELSIEVVSAWEQNRALKQAGDEMEHCLSLIIKSYAENIITRDAIKAWQKAKGEAE